LASSAKEKSILNPDNKMQYQEGDQAILIASDDDGYALSEESQDNYSEFFKSDKYVKSGRRILTIGYNRNTAYVLRDMELYVGDNSTLTMIVPNEDNKAKLLQKYPESKFCFV
jgi:hypothetical protein